MKYNKLNEKLIYLKFSVFTTLSVLFLSISSLNAQGLHLSKGREIGVYVGNTIWGLGNIYMSYAHTIEPRSFQVPKLDNYHRSAGNNAIKNASDIGFWTCALISGLSAIDGQKRIDWAYANVLVQNTLITANLTQTVKVLTGRERPSKWGANDDYHSFFSGHSSLTASAAATTLYYAYNVNNAPPHAKVLGWTAAGLSLATGIMRIEAGKHYPSDVLVGWAIGTGVALLNAHLHRPR